MNSAVGRCGDEPSGCAVTHGTDASQLLMHVYGAEGATSTGDPRNEDPARRLQDNSVIQPAGRRNLANFDLGHRVLGAGDIIFGSPDAAQMTPAQMILLLREP